MYDDRLLAPLSRRARAPEDVLRRFLWTDAVARRLMGHADVALRRRHRWACAFALDKAAEQFWRERQEPVVSAFLAGLDAGR